MTIRHFPTGLPYREVGETRIIAKDDEMANFLAGMFESIEQTPHDLATSCPEVPDDSREATTREFTVPEINWLKRIEAILRNGLPTSDKGSAETIAHAHSEIELLLESVDPDWWMK